MADFRETTGALLRLAASVGALLLVNARAHSLAGRGPRAVASVENVLFETDSSASRWRAARWPGGRYVAASGVVVYSAAFAAPVLLVLAIWVLGRMSAPDLGVSSGWGSLGSALMISLSWVGIVSSRRLTALAGADAAAGEGSRDARGGEPLRVR